MGIFRVKRIFRKCIFFGTGFAGANLSAFLAPYSALGADPDFRAKNDLFLTLLQETALFDMKTPPKSKI